jgi:hypothetical protein
MSDFDLTPVEWDWFKQLARSRPSTRVPPVAVRRKLLELKLMEEKRGGALGPTVQGRHVLKLVDDR